jgi:hypothetical protein
LAEGEVAKMPVKFRLFVTTLIVVAIAVIVGFLVYTNVINRGNDFTGKVEECPVVSVITKCNDIEAKVGSPPSCYQYPPSGVSRVYNSVDGELKCTYEEDYEEIPISFSTGGPAG